MRAPRAASRRPATHRRSPAMPAMSPMSTRGGRCAAPTPNSAREEGTTPTTQTSTAQPTPAKQSGQEMHLCSTDGAQCALCIRDHPPLIRLPADCLQTASPRALPLCRRRVGCGWPPSRACSARLAGNQLGNLALPATGPARPGPPHPGCLALRVSARVGPGGVGGVPPRNLQSREKLASEARWSGAGSHIAST